MFNFLKKQTFKDIPIVNLDELKKRTKIVVIDDEKDSFPISKIQSFGFTVEYLNKIDSNNLKRLENNEFDIIILDILDVVKEKELGDINGLDILKSLKDKNSNQIIIAFSGSSYDIEKGEFWKLADDFLKKPISLFDTKEKLESIIKENFSNENLIKKLEDLMKMQVNNKSDYKKLENYIVKNIKQQSTPDYIKLVRLGITDTSAVMTIISGLIDIYSKFNDD